MAIVCSSCSIYTENLFICIILRFMVDLACQMYPTTITISHLYVFVCLYHFAQDRVFNEHASYVAYIHIYP